MTRLREHAALSLGQLITDRIQLSRPAIVIDAPPSQLSEYPAVAVWIERMVPNYTDAGPVLEDASGTPIMAGTATDDVGNVVDGTPIMIGDGVWVMHVGSMRCRGRIWVGSRYPDKREELEEKIYLAFNEDDDAPGRIMFPLEGMQLGDYTINFGVATALINDSSWTNEHSFEARLWSWIMFDLDVPMLVPRSGPLASQLILEFSAIVDPPISAPADVASLPDLVKYTHDDAGNLVTTIL